MQTHVQTVDGHSRGIYPFSYLKSLQPRAAVNADSEPRQRSML